MAARMKQSDVFAIFSWVTTRREELEKMTRSQQVKIIQKECLSQHFSRESVGKVLSNIGVKFYEPVSGVSTNKTGVPYSTLVASHRELLDRVAAIELKLESLGVTATV